MRTYVGTLAPPSSLSREGCPPAGLANSGHFLFDWLVFENLTDKNWCPVPLRRKLGSAASHSVEIILWVCNAFPRRHSDF